ncbi:DUF6223 family protein [Actinomadura sp. WMMB 499]|uniref:DUF6223 family protein n=1 Tax=Actinomadura sp. WMMB 499 TaxID=1219491 RepID=UPI001243CED5|nr:DUF6223 family protein [Actinomadura sp. WMMB 499]QFG22372.1 hypothetical protein F7P10_15795 [Actinomadura sp. WMMB 499]
MSVRIVLAASAATHVWARPTADVFAMSPGRLGAVVAALAGLAGVALAGRALARPTASARHFAVASLLAGPFGIALGGVVAATADGGIGTGNGLGGAFVSMLVGSLATLLGALALARTRHTT